ncbi:hypothetical protein HDV01_007431 [Terramyces sp. JEL0728]|nr:hypothetical protein HDV01_007431 [Terramyces sp. JEL0728]
MEKDLHSKSKELQSLIQEKRINRDRILELCEDIILLDAGYAVHKRIDEMLWNTYFYTRFEELKLDFKRCKGEAVLLQLQSELDRANSFYKVLVLALTFDRDIDNVAGDPALIIAYKSLIYLGDIAYKLYPVGGKPHAQLALLSVYKMIDIDVLYYNCLSIGNKETSPVQRNNLDHFLLKFTMNGLSTPVESDSVGTDLLLEYLAVLDGNIKMLKFQDMGRILKLVTSFVIFVHDRDVLFDSSNQSMEKQLFRHYQVLALSFLLSMTKECALYVNSQLESGDTIEELASTVVDHLLPLSVLVTWLSSTTRIITTFTSYGAMLRPKEFENKLHDWANTIVMIVNKVASFADMDGGDDIMYADSLLKINFIVFNSEEGQYVVRDSSTKRKELQKLMKALATEKLKDEVKTLEQQQGNFRDLDLPVYVLDLNCFLNIMRQIKSWLMSKSCIVIVPFDGS